MTRARMGKRISARSEYWRERIAEQERSGVSVRRVCEEQGLTEQCFYVWRKRLQKPPQPMRFALVETAPARKRAAELELELVLKTVERLRIGDGVHPTGVCGGWAALGS